MPKRYTSKPEDLLIGIAAHSSRLTMAKKLARRVGAQILNVDDTQTDVHSEALSACVANHFSVLRQLREMATEETWCIILEDDALPVRNFRKHASNALNYAEEPLVGLFIGKVANTEINYTNREFVRENGISWFTVTHMLSAVAYAIRSNLLPQIIARYPVYPEYATVESRITRWATEARGDPFYGSPRFVYTVPSLVDHAEGESIITPGNHGDIRSGWWVGTARNWDTIALEYDC